MNLDFAPRPAPFGDYMLLAFAALTLAAVTVFGVQARADAHSAAARLQQHAVAVANALPGTVATRRPVLPAEMSRALTAPWSALLTDLETQAKRSNGDVALLRIEPDRTHGSLLLVAEARTLPAALKYVEQLQGLPSLRRAVLLSHELQKEDPQRPVRVEITANWSQGT